MFMHMVLSSKLSKTFVAFVRFLSSVNPHMHLELTLSIWGIRTCFTKPVLLILMNRLCMCFQGSHWICHVVTQIAPEVVFFMNRSNMSVQTVLGLKSFVALITFERLQYVHFFLWLFKLPTVANIWFLKKEKQKAISGTRHLKWGTSNFVRVWYSLTETIERYLFNLRKLAVNRRVEVFWIYKFIFEPKTEVI